jgi:hypothetical protein
MRGRLSGALVRFRKVCSLCTKAYFLPWKHNLQMTEGWLVGRVHRETDVVVVCRWCMYGKVDELPILAGCRDIYRLVVSMGILN